MRNAAMSMAMALALAICTTGGANADDVKVIASTAIKTALQEIAPQFEKASEYKLAITFGASARLQPELEKGEPFDLAILSTAVADALVKAGKLVAASRVDIARSGAGVAVRKGAPKPDISTVDAFKRALLATKSLSYSDAGATGQFMFAMFDKLGITAEMKPKLRMPRPGQASMQALAEGEVDMVLPQISEVVMYPGVELVGPLPPELQVYTVLPAAISTAAKSPQGAAALLKYMATPPAIAVLKAKGLEPG